jgi:hypothetical protein
MNGIEKKHLSPETIEDFVLDRLPADRRAEVEEHLEGCAGCQAAVGEERLIAAGTKVWARNALKQRLAERVAQTSRQRVPWPHVIGAAALLVVIVGIGVLYKWHQPVPESNSVISENGPQGTMDTTPVAATPAAKAAAPGNEITVKEGAPELSQQEQKNYSKDKGYFQAPAAETQQPSIAYKTDEEARDKAVGGSGVAEKKVIDRNDRSGTWVTGTVVTVVPRGVAQSDAAGASTQGVTRSRIEARKRALPAPAERTLTFVVDQYVIDRDLKAAKREEITGGGVETVPAMIIRTGDTLHIALALDSLLSPAQLQLTYVIQVSADSIHVVLPDRILGYRLPADLAR